jgi:hypothetical protein
MFTTEGLLDDRWTFGQVQVLRETALGLLRAVQ